MQNRHKVRVSLGVCQPLPRQLEHLSRAFGVNVDLRTGANRGQAIRPAMAPPVSQVSGPNPMSHPHSMPDGQTSSTALQGANSAGQQPEKRNEAGCRMKIATEQGNRRQISSLQFYPKDYTSSQAT